MNFSEPIDSIEIEFEAADNGESFTAFATNLGIANITYTNQLGTAFDGTSITTISNGQGIINFSGPTFSSFSFQHNQAGGQNGSVIERLVVNAVPEPSSLLLLSLGSLGVIARRRRIK